MVRRGYEDWNAGGLDAVLELLDPGSTRAAAEVHISARGRGSGATVEMTMFHLWTLEHGRAVRLESFLDRDTALKVADFE